MNRRGFLKSLLAVSVAGAFPAFASKGFSDTAWAVGSGAGGLDTGALASGTWYHVYKLVRSDGVEDVMFSLSASPSNVPAGYSITRKFCCFQHASGYFQHHKPVVDVMVSIP